MNVQMDAEVSQPLTEIKTPPGTIPRLFSFHMNEPMDHSNTIIHQSNESISSSDDSNSPTELNFCKKLSDKPPLIKRICAGLSSGIVGCGILGDSEDKPDTHPILNIDTSERRCQISRQLLSQSVTDRTTAHVVQPMDTVTVNENIPPAYGDNSNRLTRSFPPSPRHEFCSDESSGLRSGSPNLYTMSTCEYSAHTCLRSVFSRPNGLSANEEKDLRDAPWFQAGIPREITIEVLRQKPVGTFIVRESTSKPGYYVLSLRVPHDVKPSGVAHYLILRTKKGYKIKGFTKEFTTLTALITHHSIMQELLPCPLSRYRHNSQGYVKSYVDRDFVYMDTDQEYDIISDFRQMLDDLKLK